MSSREPSYSRVSIELPEPEAATAAQALGGLVKGRNLLVEPVVPPQPREMPEDLPPLFTEIEDPMTQELTLAVQRPHIRAFEAETPWKQNKIVAERLINGLWVNLQRFEPSVSTQSKASQLKTVFPLLVWNQSVHNPGVNVLGLRAHAISKLYKMMRSRAVGIDGIGDTTVDSRGLSTAVQTQLAESS